MPIIRVRFIVEAVEQPHGRKADGSPRFEPGETYDLMQHEAMVFIQAGVAEKIGDGGALVAEPPSRETWYPHKKE